MGDIHIPTDALVSALQPAAAQEPLHESLRYVSEDPRYHVAEPWSVVGMFDDQLRDRDNFGLEENEVGAVCAILAGISMMLITDTLFRLVVRARPTTISSHTVYRYSLLSRAVNPIEWLATFVSAQRRRCRSSKRASAGSAPDEPIACPVTASKIPYILEPMSTPKTCNMQHPQSQPNMNRIAFSIYDSDLAREVPFPHWQRVVIVLIGVFIVGTELLLIFLATNRSRNEKLDLRGIPSFEVKDSTNASIQPTVFLPCVAQPMTTKAGFFAVGSTQICAHFLRTEFKDELRYGKVAEVVFSLVDYGLLVAVGTHKFFSSFQVRVMVTIANGTQYVSRAQVEPTAVAGAVAPVLARWNMSVYHNYTINRNLNNGSVPSWAVHLKANLTRVSLPTGLIHELSVIHSRPGNSFTTAQLETIGWNFFVGAVARSALSLTGRTRAYHMNAVVGPFLDEYDGALIVRQRPWLGIFGCVVTSVVSLVVWAAVAFGLQYDTHVDERVAWLRVFTRLRRKEDFYTRSEEFVDLEQK